MMKHQHYTELLRSAGTVIYGRITYQLMESFWPTIVKNPTGNKSMDAFAVAIDDVSKLVFSHTLKNGDPVIIDWKNARVAERGIEEEVLELKQQSGKDIFVGSPSLIVATMNLNLIDEYQISVQPTIGRKWITSI